MQSFFYDKQIRRFLTQFIRVVSGFQVEFGQGANGQNALQQVPVIYGDPSRQAAQILKNNSENMLNSVPAIAVYISALDYDRDRMQDPSFVGKINLQKRAYDPVTGEYLNTAGDAYTVERLMPVPYKLGIKMDIWTSNTEQKLQLWEQICTLFNPSLEIQSTDNYVDWGSLTVVDLKNTLWDSRSIPSGSDESISIATMQFEMPIWISSPAKVKRLGVITKIVGNIFDATTGGISNDIFSDSDLMARRVWTFRDYKLLYLGNTLRLVRYNQLTNGTEEQYDSWRILLDQYGSIRDGLSQIRLDHPDGASQTIGTIALHPTDDSALLYSPMIDTLPANTLSAVAAIIDPTTVNVDNLNLLSPAVGTRYLILDNIGSYNNAQGSIAWNGNSQPVFIANANDIIEYTTNGWVVSFDSQSSEHYEFVTNLNTNVQYKWDYLAHEWTKSVEGVYDPLNWSIVI